MVYTKEELWELFINSGTIIKLNEGYGLNSIFKGKINSLKKSSYCLNYPDKFKGLGDMVIYKRVMEDCAIPLMHEGDMTYFVRTQNQGSVRKLKGILATSDIDYTVFVNKIKAFYSKDAAIPGFAKFINEGTWETIYGASEAAGVTTTTKGVI